MPRKSVVLDDAPAAPAIQPEMLTKLKKEDMKQAVVERFKATSEAPAPAKAKERKRSPYWQASDEEC
ncbi:MAG TPA: hypothetical protein VLV47_00410 [Candidatus Bathyarchaeia archaeon]|nr:hypothetical protein [Candidatus Bathyarchaeia archaeon]